jgi:hypothetical protein
MQYLSPARGETVLHSTLGLGMIFRSWVITMRKLILNTQSDAGGQDEKIPLVRWAIKAHSLLLLAPKNATAKISTGTAIINPMIGMIVKLMTVSAKPTKSKNKPMAKSEILSK